MNEVHIIICEKWVRYILHEWLVLEVHSNKNVAEKRAEELQNQYGIASMDRSVQYSLRCCELHS